MIYFIYHFIITIIIWFSHHKRCWKEEKDYRTLSDPCKSRHGCNRPFLSSPQPLFQGESTCETLAVVISAYFNMNEDTLCERYWGLLGNGLLRVILDISGSNFQTNHTSLLKQKRLGKLPWVINYFWNDWCISNKNMYYTLLCGFETPVK